MQNFKNVQPIENLGKLNLELLKNRFLNLKTDEIIVTNERIKHIKQRHMEDYELFLIYGKKCVQQPDIILKDEKNLGTIFMIKRISETNLNVIVRLALNSDKEGLKNSVMTFYRVRDKNLKKLMGKHEILYNCTEFK